MVFKKKKKAPMQNMDHFGTVIWFRDTIAVKMCWKYSDFELDMPVSRSVWDPRPKKDIYYCLLGDRHYEIYLREFVMKGALLRAYFMTLDVL